jgi:hypothetical protein
MEVAQQAAAFGIFRRLVGTALKSAVLEACTFPPKAHRPEALPSSYYGPAPAAVGGREAPYFGAYALRCVSLACRAAVYPSPGRVFSFPTNCDLACEAVWLWEVYFRNPSNREAVP